MPLSLPSLKGREVVQPGRIWRFERQGRSLNVMNYKVYILWSEVLQKFYVGSTNDLDDRLYRHNSGQSTYSAKGIPWNLICSFDCADRKEAVNLENKIKKRGIERFLLNQNISFGR
jgi:putative endonuclease